MKEEPLILPDSPEAATLMTLTGWVSAKGRFFGNNEQLARSDGSTASYCNACHAIIPRQHYTLCDACSSAQTIASYHRRKKKVPEPGDVLYSEATEDYYFLNGLDEAQEALDDMDPEEGEERTLASLRLVICDPCYIWPIGSDHWCDITPEDTDGELPDELEEALKVLNAVIEKLPPFSWAPGKYAVDLGEEAV